MRVECYFDDDAGVRLRDASSGRMLLIYAGLLIPDMAPKGSHHPLLKPEPDIYIDMRQELYDGLHRALFSYMRSGGKDFSIGSVDRENGLDVSVCALEDQFLKELMSGLKKVNEGSGSDISDRCSSVMFTDDSEESSG